MIDVTQAHIHEGAIHNNVPNVAVLFGPRDKENRTGPVNGLLQQGTLMTDDLKEKKTLTAVFQAMRADGAYFNVPTEANPKGEVRGQIVTIKDPKVVAELFFASASGTNKFSDPVGTDARCLASFRVVDAGKGLKYKPKCWNLVGATPAHIHLGEGTKNGPSAAFLFWLVFSMEEINGKLSSGVLADVAVVVAGMTLDDIIDAMRFDAAYLNVHTEENPLGEVSGKISRVVNLAGGF